MDSRNAQSANDSKKVIKYLSTIFFDHDEIRNLDIFPLEDVFERIAKRCSINYLKSAHVSDINQMHPLSRARILVSHDHLTDAIAASNKSPLYAESYQYPMVAMVEIDKNAAKYAVHEWGIKRDDILRLYHPNHDNESRRDCKIIHTTCPVTKYNIIENPNSKALPERKEAIRHFINMIILLLQHQHDKSSPLASNHLPRELLLSIINIYGEIYARELGVDNAFTDRAISQVTESTQRIYSARMNNLGLFTMPKETDNLVNVEMKDVKGKTADHYRCTIS